jgi:hypothetical protein
MNREDEILKKWMSEAGRERPDEGFSDRVLAAIRTSGSASPVYQPVISPLGIRLIGLGIAAIFAGVILFVPGGQESGSASYFDRLTQWWSQSVPTPDIRILNDGIGWLDFDPSILHISPLFGYALVALAITSLLSAYLNNHFLRI